MMCFATSPGLVERASMYAMEPGRLGSTVSSQRTGKRLVTPSASAPGPSALCKAGATPGGD